MVMHKDSDQDQALAVVQVQSPQEVTTVQTAAMQQLSQVQQYPMAATPTEEQAETVPVSSHLLSHLSTPLHMDTHQTAVSLPTPTSMQPPVLLAVGVMLRL